MDIQKDIEILEVNLKENGNKMPPDVKDALTHAITALKFANIFQEAFQLYQDTPPPQ